MARSDDPSLRRAQHRAWGALHRAAAPQAVQLLKRRRALAAELGLREGFYDALLALRGVAPAELTALLGPLETTTRAAYEAALTEARTKAGLSRVAPWDLELLVRKLGDLPDDLFPAEGALPFARAIDQQTGALEVPDDAEPTWATSPFLATYPVYTQSYTLAAMLSCQVRGALRARFGGDWLGRGAGAMLAEQLVFDGARTTTDEKMIRATGARLSPGAYAAWLAG